MSAKSPKLILMLVFPNTPTLPHFLSKSFPFFAAAKKLQLVALETVISVAKAVTFIEGSTALLRIGRFRIEKRAPLIHWEEGVVVFFCINIRFSWLWKSCYENNCDVSVFAATAWK